MKNVFLLLFFLTTASTFGSAGPVENIIGATITNIGDIDTYVLTPTVGGSYAWAVSGGEIISGQGTPIVVVHWDSKGPGSVAVNVNNDSDIVIIDTNSSKN